MADAARSEPMLHPSRGGGGRPPEGRAQARRELQRSHLEARRIENKRPKMSCASGLTARFCDLERVLSRPSAAHWQVHVAGVAMVSCRPIRTFKDGPLRGSSAKRTTRKHAWGFF
jgi:hypothetical protein